LLWAERSQSVGLKSGLRIRLLSNPIAKCGWERNREVFTPGLLSSAIVAFRSELLKKCSRKDANDTKNTTFLGFSLRLRTVA